MKDMFNEDRKELINQQAENTNMPADEPSQKNMEQNGKKKLTEQEKKKAHKEIDKLLEMEMEVPTNLIEKIAPF